MTGAWDSGRLAEALGVKRSSIASMVWLGSLPKPDTRKGRHAYWNDATVRPLLERRKNGDRRCTRHLKGFYNSREICDMVPGMIQQDLYGCIARGLFPRAPRRVGRINYWAAGDIDPLLPGLRAQFAFKGYTRTSHSSGIDPERVYTSADILRLVPHLPRKSLLGMVAEGTFPDPERTRTWNGTERLTWLGSDIAGRIGELRAEIARLKRDAWFSNDICRVFGLSDTIQIHNLVKTGKIPGHDGHLFTRKYWLKSSVIGWIEKHAGKRAGVYVPDGVLAVPDPWRVQVAAARNAPDGVLERAIGRARQNAAYYESVAAELEREQGRRNAGKGKA